MPLASRLFASRPGLRVLQLAWHPLSPSHAVLLTSDSCLRMYHASAADAPAPEQEFELAAALRSLSASSGGSGVSSSSGSHPSGRAASSLPLGLRALSLSANASSSSPSVAFAASPVPSFAAARRATGFAFGPDWGPWERFTIYVQASDGALFSLCPVAPFGLPLESAAARALQSSAAATGSSSSSSEARAWVQRALPPDSSSSSSKSIVRVRPHALDEHSPALAGPLPLLIPGGSAGGGKGSENGITSTHHLCPPGDSTVGLALLALRPGAIAVLQATASGKIGAAALAGAAAASPAFGPSAPRVAVSSRFSDGDGLFSSSSLSSAAAAAAATTAVSSVCRAAAPTRGRRLLLLDVVDLSGGGRKSKEAASFDSDDDGDSDDSDDDDSDDDDDLGPSSSPSSTKMKKSGLPITMLPDPDDEARIYALSPSSGEVFAVDIDWLPALAARLASSSSSSSSSAAPAGGTNGSGSSSSSLISTGLPRARARALRRGPTALVGSRPVGAAAVAAPPAEGGLVLLLEGGEAALARCARPAGASALAAAASAASAGISSRAPAGAAGDLLALSRSPLLLSAAAQQETAAEAAENPPPSPALARVLAGPPPLPELPPGRDPSAPSGPCPSGSNDASQPAGAAALAASAKALLDGPIEFAHASSLALSGAFAELKEAAAAATERGRALRAKADAALGQRERSSIERLSRAKAMQENLEARARLLARLHWGLPGAPATAAERMFAQKELPEAEAEVGALASEVKALRRRAAALHLRLEAAGGAGGAGAGESEKHLAPSVAAAAAAAADRRRHPRPPPPATLRRVREAAVEQASVAQALARRLRRLEEIVAEAEDEAATGVGSGAW